MPGVHQGFHGIAAKSAAPREACRCVSMNDIMNNSEENFGVIYEKKEYAGFLKRVGGRQRGRILIIETRVRQGGRILIINC